MVRCLLFLFVFCVSLFGIDIDPKVLREIIANNPDAYKEKIVLAKYYHNNSNDIKAQMLIDEVLATRPKDSSALALRDEIQERIYIQDTLKKASVVKPIDKADAQKKLDYYYMEHDFDFFIQLYNALCKSGVELQDKYDQQAAKIYMDMGKYKESYEVIKRLKNPLTRESKKLKANICYLNGNYLCAVKYFEMFYNDGEDFTTGYRLLESYINTDNISKAKRLYPFLKRKYPDDKSLKDIGQKITNAQLVGIKQDKNRYEKNKNFTNLEIYTSHLYSSGQKKEAIEITHDFNSAFATKESILLEAKYLSWSGDTKAALKVLRDPILDNSTKAKLMKGKIYSWDMDIPKAKYYLDDVIKNTNNPQTLYEAKKAKAFVYMWNKEDKKARELFERLKAQNPDDKEIQEGIMVLNHDYNSLINIYERRVKESNNLQDIKKLALFYIQNKEYYKGFGYLEYYAIKNDTSKSYFLLAQNYYWSGFFKEALDVLGESEQKYGDFEQNRDLKAKILKLYPRVKTMQTQDIDKISSKHLKLAQKLYFERYFQTSLKYYTFYLQQHPEDYEVRYQYAFALENSAKYADALGEFYLMFEKMDTDELKYHYAYNLMKTSQTKKAKELFLQLQKNLYDKADKEFVKFIYQWRDAWQSKDFKRYGSFYGEKFLKDKSWVSKKKNIFLNAKYIKVDIKDILSKEFEDGRYEVRFYQTYTKDDMQDSGYKTLYLLCDKTKHECKITKEIWKKANYKKEVTLMPYIKRSLEEIKHSQSKKKTTF